MASKMDYDILTESLAEISGTLKAIADNQSVLRDELANINSSIQAISQSGTYSLSNVCDKLDSIDFELTGIDSSITNIT